MWVSKHDLLRAMLLCTYLYADCVCFFFQWMPHQLVGVLFVFVFSSVLHDFYVGITMGFFLPVFICLYAIIGGEKCLQ